MFSDKESWPIKKLKAVLSHEIVWALPLSGMLLIAYSVGYGIPYAVVYVAMVSAHFFNFFGQRYKNLIDENQLDFSLHRRVFDFRYLSKMLFLIIVPLNLAALNINPWNNLDWGRSNLYDENYDVLVNIANDLIGVRKDYLQGLSADLSGDFVNYSTALFAFLLLVIFLFLVSLPVYSYYQFCSWRVRVGVEYAEYGRTRLLTSEYFFSSIAVFYLFRVKHVIDLIQGPEVNRSDLYAYFLSSAVAFFSFAPIFLGYFIVIALGIRSKNKSVNALHRNR